MTQRVAEASRRAAIDAGISGANRVCLFVVGDDEEMSLASLLRTLDSLTDCNVKQAWGDRSVTRTPQSTQTTAGQPDETHSASGPNARTFALIQVLGDVVGGLQARPDESPVRRHQMESDCRNHRYTGAVMVTAEYALLRELATGGTQAAIARRIRKSQRTVERQVSSLMVKLGCESLFQAGACAALLGLISLESVLGDKPDNVGPAQGAEPAN
jgi:DNA-binding CsgD family transcriptional regulator